MKTNKKIQLRNNFNLKLVSILLILTMVSYVFLNIINENKSYAAQTRESYSSKINNYPGYK